jgi:hypothetical protein
LGGKQAKSAKNRVFGCLKGLAREGCETDEGFSATNRELFVAGRRWKLARHGVPGLWFVK